MNSFSSINNTSSDSVKKATGKGWEEWIRLLDDLNASTMTHKQIAQMLFDKGYIESGWWCQQVTVGWEKFHGRELDATNKGYQVSVQGSVALKPKEVWQLLTSDKWVYIWLGVLSAKFKLEKGQLFQTTGGITAQLRTFKAEQYLRLAYTPKNYSQATTLIVGLMPNATGTAVSFTQEKLASSQERTAMKAHWEAIIKKLQELV